MEEVRMKLEPTEFAAAYIQTLPHIRKRDEFNSDDEFNEYLDERQALYFDEFFRASRYAMSEFQNMLDSRSEGK